MLKAAVETIPLHTEMQQNVKNSKENEWQENVARTINVIVGMGFNWFFLTPPHHFPYSYFLAPNLAKTVLSSSSQT